MLENVRGTIIFEMLIETVLAKGTEAAVYGGVLKVAARDACHAGFVAIDSLSLPRMALREVLARGNDESRRRATKGALLRNSRRDNLDRPVIRTAPLADAVDAEHMTAAYEQPICHRLLIANAAQLLLLSCRGCLDLRRGCIRGDMLKPALVASATKAGSVEMASFALVIRRQLL